MSHRSPRDRTQIASAPDPPRRRRALAKRHSCMRTKPKQAVRLERKCFATDFVSYFGIRGRIYPAENCLTRLASGPRQKDPDSPAGATGALSAGVMRLAKAKGTSRGRWAARTAALNVRETIAERNRVCT